VATEYKNDRKTYEAHAKEWVIKYANPAVNHQKVKSLMEMGFSEQQCEMALMHCGYDQEKALE
jgi:uncharacterized UBP type Zn finger protein